MNQSVRLKPTHDLGYSLKVSLDWNGHLQDHQKLAFVGEIPELGEWKQAKAFLKKDHTGFYVLTQPIVTKKHFFKGKFAVYDPHAGLKIQFERGIDRIFDLRLIENDNNPLTQVET